MTASVPTEIHARLLAEYVASTAPDPAGSRELAARYGLLPLYRDFMGFIGLAADGEVAFVAWDPPHDPELVGESSWRRVALAQGAAHYPELAGLRPARPDDAIECPTCRGTGRALLGGREAPAGIICQCGGLGWLPPAEVTPPSRP